MNLCKLWLAILATLICAAPSHAAMLFGMATSQLYSIDTDLVTATLIGSDGRLVLSEIEHDSVATLYGSDTDDNTDFRTINQATGAVVSTTTLTFPTGGNVITAMEFVGSTLYAGFTTEGPPGGPSSLVTINTTTGVVTTVGATGIGVPLGGLAYNGNTLYAVTSGGSGGQLYTINVATGAASLVGPTGFNMTALEFGSDGVLYGLPNIQSPSAGHLLSLNTATGAAIDLGDLGVAFLNALTSPTAIPEPTSLVLLGAGGLALVARRQRPTCLIRLSHQHPKVKTTQL